VSRRRTPTPTTPELPVEPVYIAPACTCSKYPFAHVHAPEPNLKVEHMDGNEFFSWPKEQVTVRQRKTASDKCPQRSKASRSDNRKQGAT